MPITAAQAQQALNGHLGHILLFIAWVPIFGFVLLHEKRKERALARVASTGSRATDTMVDTALPRTATDTIWLQTMAVASVCAAAPHVAVMPSHFKESLWYGTFFLGAALSQIGFAAWVLIRPSRAVVTAGIVGSILIVALWLFTRTVEVPLGPGRGEVETIGLLDVVSTSAEVATATFGVLALRTWFGSPAWRWAQWTAGLRIAAPVIITAALLACEFGDRG